jgi:LacI family transcriptional regulator
VNSKKKVTIKDVAEHANASMSTVSMVVNNKGYVSDGKKKEIMKSVRELGYVPSATARNLASNRTNNIGFILRESHFTLSEPFYTRIFLGTEFESKHHNYYVLLATVTDNYEKDVDTPRLLKERNVDGIIVAGKVSTALLEEIEDSGVPFVLVDYQYKSFPSITADNLNAGIEAIRHLIEKGHEKIAFIGADSMHPSISARLEGYQLGMLKSNINDTGDLVFIDNDNPPRLQTGYTLAERMFSAEKIPTAVFCANDALALGVIKYADEHDIKIPKDLAVVGFDDVEGANNVSPKLTTVRILKEQMGELALSHLSEIIEESPKKVSKFKRSNHMLTVPTELVVRESS